MFIKIKVLLPVELILNLFFCHKRTAAAAKTSAANVVVSSATFADTAPDFNAYNKKKVSILKKLKKEWTTLFSFLPIIYIAWEYLMKRY